MKMPTESIVGRLPDFLVIGGTKCGSSSLHGYLCSHPDVYMHPITELRYFSRQHNWHRGPDWYRAQFASVKDEQVVGEASNGYTRHPVYDGVAERVHAMLPNARLIYTMRHPTKRLESHYRHRLVTGIEWRSADDAVAKDPGYIAASNYGQQVREYLRLFPREQLLVVRLEQTIANPRQTQRRICEFLGVREPDGLNWPHNNETARRRAAPALLRQMSRLRAAQPLVRSIANRLAKSRLRYRLPRANEPRFELSPGMRQRLAATFTEDVKLLEQLLGERFDEWRFDETDDAANDRPTGSHQSDAS